MEIAKAYSENKAVYVRHEELRYLHEFLTNSFSNVSYSANCIDDSTIHFNNIEELLSFENPNFRKIRSLEIYGDNEDGESKFYKPYLTYKNNLRIILGDKHMTSTISYKFNLNDLDTANRLENELKLRLKEFRPWYWFLAKFNFVLGISAAWFILSMLTGILSIQEKIEKMPIQKTSPDLSLNEHLVIIFAGIALIYSISYPLNKIKEYVFPKTVIELGRQKKRNNNRHQVIYLIFIGVFLALLLNVLGGFIYDFIKGVKK